MEARGPCSTGDVISKFAILEDVVFVESLPKTSVGKLDKKRIRATYAVSTTIPTDRK